MSVWFVSRHLGAIEWIKQKNIHIDYFIEHLDIHQIQKNDTVIGVLPIPLAAQVCEKGAKFYCLSVEVERSQRGTELSAEQLTAQNCHLQSFFIQKC